MSAPSDRSLELLLQHAAELAVGAGDLLQARFGTLGWHDADRKGGRYRDLVSDADREAESFLIDRIPATDDVVGEEGSRRSTGAARRWIVDPLDGTINFLRGIPFWAVSIAVVEAEEVVAAVVHAPALEQTFTGSRGGGARLNDRPVRVSGTSGLRDAVLGTGFAYNRDEVPDDNLQNWRNLALASAGMRRMGAASIDLAYTASGMLDGFWELYLEPWDVGAGTLLVREAGGKVSDFRGTEDLTAVLGGRNIVASNGHIHDELRGRLLPLVGL